MSEFQELIKNFSKCRDYVRDFFVYGFKSRADFSAKSGRTYDDERRRIESWLNEYVKADYGVESEKASASKGRSKNISLQMDSNLLETNPLYRVWKTKSFTDNDIMLHFFLLDILDDGNSLSITELADEIAARYEVVLDSQMIRRKCNEYVKEGLLQAQKSGKTTRYSRDITWQELTTNTAADALDAPENPCPDSLLDAIRFYQLSAPFGMIGSTILDNQKAVNSHFRIKHSFFVHTLEEEIVFQLLQAMREKRSILASCQSNKNADMRREAGVPLQFFVSTRTGRRYICMYRTTTKRFLCLRLDQIKKVEQQEQFPEYDQIYEKLLKNRGQAWGVSFQGSNQSREQRLMLTLHIDEKQEGYILERLSREGKGGRVSHIGKNTYTYETEIFDIQEMAPWLRTFIGRIIAIETTNRQFSSRFQSDLEALYRMYEID